MLLKGMVLSSLCPLSPLLKWPHTSMVSVITHFYINHMYKGFPLILASLGLWQTNLGFKDCGTLFTGWGRDHLTPLDIGLVSAGLIRSTWMTVVACLTFNLAKAIMFCYNSVQWSASITDPECQISLWIFNCKIEKSYTISNIAAIP